MAPSFHRVGSSFWFELPFRFIEQGFFLLNLHFIIIILDQYKFDLNFSVVLLAL